MIEPASPILLFDSGIGGLTVHDALREMMPDAPIIYAADLAGLPYGDKSEAEIAARVAGLLGRMAERFRPRLACIACNTASTIALGMVRDVLEIPIVGTVPAIKPAAAITRSGVIALIGTRATIRQAYVDRLEAEFAADKTLIRFAAPALVELAEVKLRGGRIDRAVLRDALSELRDHPDADMIDTVVLACTHFPLLAEELNEALGGAVRLIDGSDGIARRIVSLTRGQPFAKDAPNRFVHTGADGDHEGLRAALARRDLTTLEQF